MRDCLACNILIKKQTSILILVLEQTKSKMPKNSETELKIKKSKN